MSETASQLTGVLLFAQPFFQIKENIKAPRHWPVVVVVVVVVAAAMVVVVVVVVVGGGGIHRWPVSNAENVSIWWRHNGSNIVCQ